MSDERPEPKGKDHPLLHYQAGVMDAMLGAMHKEDKALVLEYLGLAVATEAPPEGRKFGEEPTPRKKQ
jgi:hypothetical protein